MYKKFIIIFVIFCFLGCINQDGYTIKIPISSVNNKLQEKFPLTKDVKYATIILKEPKLKTDKNSDRIQIALVFVVYNILVNIKGKIDISGNILYEQKTKKIFFINPRIDNINLFKKDVTNIFNKIEYVIANIINETFKKFSIYTIKQDNLKAKIATKIIKNIKIKNGDILVTLGF